MGNIRRSRGYSFEHTLVQRLNNGVWNARRLGGSSTGLPDIIAVNNTEAILLSIEAKSGTGDILYEIDDIDAVKCTYDGKIFSVKGGRSKTINLPDYVMPFNHNNDSGAS